MSEPFPRLLQVIHEQLQDRPAKLGGLDDKEIERAGVKVGQFEIARMILETDHVRTSQRHQQNAPFSPRCSDSF